MSGDQTEHILGLAQALLCHLATSDVLQHRLEFDRAAIVRANPLHGALLPHRTAVRRDDFGVVGHHGVVRRQALEITQRNVAVFRRERVQELRPDQVPSVLGLETAIRVVYETDFPTFGEPANHLRLVLHHPAVAFLALAHGTLRVDLFGGSSGE